MDEAANRPEPNARRSRHGGSRGIPAFAFIMLAISVLPPLLMFFPKLDAELVEERRPLAPAPTHWQGALLDINGNFQVAEKWFNDHLGLRNLMIRTKNEIDYRLFRTSSRIYFGSHGQLFSRKINDGEILDTQNLLAIPGKFDKVYDGIVKFTERLQQDGITPIYVFPYMKQYFYQDDLPIFAPHLKFPTHYQQLNQRLLADPRLHVIDTYTPFVPKKGAPPTYFLQDFHWTDAAAFAVAKAIVGEISKLEGRKSNVWSHDLVPKMVRYEGSEGRFAARLFMPPILGEEIVKNYKKRPRTQFDPRKTGIEFETDLVQDSSLLPPTCMFGNSYSDGLLYDGLDVYFQKFIRLDREANIVDSPKVIKGQCKYFIVQLLEIQAAVIDSFTQGPR